MARLLEDSSVMTRVLVSGSANDDDVLDVGKWNSNHYQSGEGVMIRLTREEENVFNVFRQTVEEYNNSNSNNSNNNNNNQADGGAKEKLVVRVAGGWVRDKLLGAETHDVDVAVNILTGVQFATLVQQRLAQQGSSRTSAKIGVIAANPEQSKHLETATMVVEGLECDFCNLRAQETYTSDSRIPTTRFGTPLEDAQRRDFRCNALFWNLGTNRAEDFTREGLNDLLLRHVLVTPLQDPHETFADDPLRVLRAIRFAVRFRFAMNETLRQACASPLIHQALRTKVSRERVGKELEGMLSGKRADPIQALQTIHSLSLSSSVFSLPQALLQEEEEQLAWQQSQASLALLEKPPEKSVDLRLWSLAVCLLPFRSFTYQDRKRKPHLVVEYIMRESIKFKNKDVIAMVSIMETVERYANLLLAEEEGFPRLQAGLLLRSSKELWITSLWVSTVLLMMQSENSGVDWVERTKALQHEIVANQVLDGCWKMKPLLDGRALIRSLGLPKGPVVGVYLEEQVKWMLMNPNGTKEECESHLKMKKQQADERERQKRQLDQSNGEEPTNKMIRENNQ